MHRRETLYTLAVALWLGALACGDDEDHVPDDAGASGSGGDVAEAGAGGGAGVGGRPPISCTPKTFSLDARCELGRGDCGRSQAELLRELCEQRLACGGGFMCTQIAVGSNSCGGSSTVTVIGVDIHGVMHHYDAAGELVGVREDDPHSCPRQRPLRRYGEDCSVDTSERFDCSELDADGGVEDAGI